MTSYGSIDDTNQTMRLITDDLDDFDDITIKSLDSKVIRLRFYNILLCLTVLINIIYAGVMRTNNDELKISYNFTIAGCVFFIIGLILITRITSSKYTISSMSSKIWNLTNLCILIICFGVLLEFIGMEVKMSKNCKKISNTRDKINCDVC